MSLIDSLLKVDKNKFIRETKQIEIKRISNMTGSEFVFTIQSLTPQEEKEISDKAFKVGRKNKFDFDTDLNKKLTLIKGVKDFDFKDKKLMDHLGAINSFDVIDKLLLPGEIEEIVDQIRQISGYDDGVVEEIKN